MSMDFDTAELYGCDDPEFLQHSDPWDAVWEILEDLEGPIREAVEGIAPLTVTAYKRVEPDDATVRRWAENAIDFIHEGYCDELGPPIECEWSPSKEDIDKLEVVVRDHIKQVGVWACEPVAAQEYSEAELLEAIAAEHPEWL